MLPKYFGVKKIVVGGYGNNLKWVNVVSLVGFLLS